MLKLAVRDSAQGCLLEHFLPAPKDKQSDQKIDNNEAPLWTLFIYFGRLFDGQRYVWLLFHMVNVTWAAQ
jgi:hypothetical protein